MTRAVLMSSWLCAVAACGGGAQPTVQDSAGVADAVDSINASDAFETIDTIEMADVGAKDTIAVDTIEVAPDTTPLETTPEVDAEIDITPEVEVTPTCAERPVAFVPETEPEAWNRLDSQTIAALGAPNHRGQDVVVQVGNPQVLVAKFAYAFVDKDMVCEDVDIWVQREAPCGAWEWLGASRASDSPDDSLECVNYGMTYGVEDDGGRVYFEVPDALALPIGRHPVRMVMRGDRSLASFDLIVVAPGTQAILTDIDGTLTTADTELTTEMVLAMFDESYDQQMYPSADAVMQTYADKGYLVVYMSGRPGFLRRMTEHWLEPRFPPGPLHGTDHLAQVEPNIDHTGVYKRDYIDLLQAQGIDFVATYGNADTDIWAYSEAGIPNERIYIIGPLAGDKGTVPVTGGYPAHLPFVQAFPDATIPAPPSFRWW